MKIDALPQALSGVVESIDQFLSKVTPADRNLRNTKQRQIDQVPQFFSQKRSKGRCEDQPRRS